jgi:hypothetical protein
MSALNDHIDTISMRPQLERLGEGALTDVAPLTARSDSGTAQISADGENVRFIFGVARSGTSWLAKIFDSHPDVLYRNEPDLILRDAQIPMLCQVEEIESFRDRARLYLQQLVNVRTLKATGSLPIFAKHYQGPVTRKLRSSIVYALHLAQAILPGAEWPTRIPIPDFLTGDSDSRPIIVIKSVGSCGRSRLYTDALPASRVVFIIRHPCGHVASMLRGIALGKFPRAPIPPIPTNRAVQFGLTPERFEALSLVEQLAWYWVILNQKALDDLAGTPRVRVIRYRDLCAEPLKVARELIEFAGLSWEPQTATFIEKSTHYKGPDRYYKVLKDSIATENKWRDELSLDDQRRIVDIARQVPAGRLFD